MKDSSTFAPSSTLAWVLLGPAPCCLLLSMSASKFPVSDNLQRQTWQVNVKLAGALAMSILANWLSLTNPGVRLAYRWIDVLASNVKP